MTENLPQSPGPNILKPRTPRLQDIAYQTIIGSSKTSEKKDNEITEQTAVIHMFSNLTKALKDTAKTDVPYPPKFNGNDSMWEKWLTQWRAYLKVKDWLSTHDHPIGPGAPDFDVGINDKIYNALTHLCGRGKASAYLENAGEFDDHGAGKQLMLRYDGFSKQKHSSLRKCLESIKHISGTNMSDHIDRFEKLCGQMGSCGQTPDEEQKMDWFMQSVHERIYEATRANCTNLMLEDNLTFGKIVKLYTHACFDRYPHFQTMEMEDSKGNRYTNNSTKFNNKKGKGFQNGQGRKNKGKANSSYQNSRDGRRNETRNHSPQRMTKLVEQSTILHAKRNTSRMGKGDKE
jgi:hypothetical protein